MATPVAASPIGGNIVHSMSAPATFAPRFPAAVAAASPWEGSPMPWTAPGFADPVSHVRAHTPASGPDDDDEDDEDDEDTGRGGTSGGSIDPDDDDLEDVDEDEEDDDDPLWAVRIVCAPRTARRGASVLH
jgi:hypothetical protein